MQPTQNTALLAEHPAPAALSENPAITLRAAARYLVRHGWIQGAYYDASTGSFTPAACMVGAIAHVCYGGPCETPGEMFGFPGFDEYETAITWLDRYLLDTYGDIAYGFNDTRGRTRIGVLVALQGAAGAWDRTHGGAA